MLTSKVRSPGSFVQLQPDAKYKRTWTFVPDRTGNDHDISGADAGSARSTEKIDCGVDAGTLAVRPIV
jgi:hypothetical protein